MSQPAQQTAIGSIDELYPLGALIRRSVGCTVYETEFVEEERALPAIIKIREAETRDAEILSHRLRSAGALEHPNFLKIYATGSSTLEDVPVFYVVMERAHESLEAVLAERALTITETREMLSPVLDALDYLHKNGYVHSRLRPSNVLAVNDRLKLSADTIIRGDDEVAAEDMRALGSLIVYALTQKIASHEFAEIPRPLADIVRHCLDPEPAKRWTVDQVKASLTAPTLVAEDITSAQKDVSVASDPPKGLPGWIYASLAALILAVLLAAIFRNNAPPPAAIPFASAGSRVSPQPVTAKVPPQVTPVPGKGSGWAVIVAAYNARQPAEKRMTELAKKWPNFKITVIESRGTKTAYFLTLGQNLPEDQAQTLRKRAVESGLPRDTYIKRLS